MQANHNMVTLDDLWLPLGLALALAVVVWIPSAVFTKSIEKGALISSWITFTFLIYGHVLRLLMLYVWLTPNLELFFALYTIALAAGLILILRIPRDFKLADLTFVLNVLSFGLLVMPLSQILMWNQPNYALIKQENVAKSAQSNKLARSQKPDIYYIILDGMERSDYLKSVFQIDDSDFTTFLKANGFYIATDSHSNYPYTILSMSSSLNMQYLNLSGDQKERDWHPLYPMIEDNEVMKFLKQEGYKCVHLDSAWSVTRNSPKADQVFNLTWANSFVSTAAALTPLGVHFKYIHPIHDELRSHRLRILHTLADIAPSPGPKFVFAHVLMPHMPFLFGANGEPINGSLNMHMQEWTDKDGYKNQVTFLLKELKIALQTVLDRSETSPIIIIQGDHGAGSTAEFDKTEPSADFLRERLSIFNAYHLPPNEKGNGNKNQASVLYNSITPVNSFRTIFNDYFQAKLPLLPDKSFYSPFESPFQLRDVTEEIAEPQMQPQIPTTSTPSQNQPLQP